MKKYSINYLHHEKNNRKSKTMDVSVIIVNYNTKEITRNCIESIFAKTCGLNFEIILVDNASTDGSKELFEKDTRIKYIYSNENLGFGRANNLGYMQSKGDYLFLLNSDTLLLNNAIKIFYEEVKKSAPEVAALGCQLVDANNNQIHSYGYYPSFLFLFIDVIRFSFPFLRYNAEALIRIFADSSPYVDYVTGADVFMRRSVVDKLGLFDESYFMYCEDMELQFRYRLQGYFSKIISAPQILHYNGFSSSAKKRSLKSFYMGMCSRFVFLKTHHNKKVYYICRIIHLLEMPRVLLDTYPFKDKVHVLKLLLGFSSFDYNNCRNTLLNW